MAFSTTITLMRYDTQKEETLAVLVFSPRPDASSSLVIQEELPVLRSTPVTIGSALTPDGNLSFTVFHCGVQHLLALLGGILWLRFSVFACLTSDFCTPPLRRWIHEGGIT